MSSLTPFRAFSAIVVFVALGASGCTPGPEPGESPLLVARQELAGVTLTDGRVVVAGGRYERFSDDLASVEVRAVDGTWTEVAPLGAPVTGAAGAAFADGRVVFAGGRRGDTAVADAWVSDAQLTQFTAVPLPSPRIDHELIAADDGLILIGGIDENGQQSTSVFRLRPDATAWEELPALGTPRSGAAAFVLEDQSVLVIGGRSRSNSLATTELLSADRAAWVEGPRLQTARHDFMAARNPAGDIGIVGGIGMHGNLESGELLRAGSTAWAVWSRLPEVAIGGCLYERDGAWFVAGGMKPTTDHSGIQAQRVLELRAGTQTWALGRPLHEGRYRPYCAHLPDGRALLVGGATSRLRAIGSTDAIPLAPYEP
jgi:hypothetical protein